MQINIEKGMTIRGFEIIESLPLPELEAHGVWARHIKTGAEVFHVVNVDRENLFAFAFATPPEDNTGAAHILEHSALCGSEAYPLKDAFLVLAQGSLQTFLNAWTFPDRTVYPASSVNEQDYFNLMGVYGDAVFRPLLSEWTFLQEGVRLNFSAQDAPGGERLEYTGVVYNEMKGAYSSLDAYAGLWSTRALLPETPYDFESGGDPEFIPDLSWEGLKAFHRSRYAPGNCRVFLAGNIPTEKQFAFLDERFFGPQDDASGVPRKAGTVPGRLPLIPRAPRWTSPRSFRIPCPAGGESKPTVLLSWLCGDILDSEENMALAALTEVLLGHDGSPLTRTLIESGLGEDLSPASGLEGEIRETLFCAGLRGVDKGNARAVETLIMETLRRLAEEGIPPEEIEAALLGMEFSNREIRRHGGPWSLVWMRRSLKSWIHGGTPWDSILFRPGFEALKKKLTPHDRDRGKTGYFAGLIKKYLLDNPHRAFILIEPEEGYLEKKEEELAVRLREKERALSEAEKRTIRETNVELIKIQEKADSRETLALIPHLSRGDLSPEIERIPRSLWDAGGIPALTHDLYTNGISYADLAFPLDILPPEDYPWLPFFSRVVVSVGLPGMDYAEVSSLLARTAGGFNAILESSSTAPGTPRALPCPGGIFDLAGRDWIVYRLKALDEKMGPSLDLALRLITEADFSDQRRIRDLALEMKNEGDASVAPAGHNYAASRSGRRFSRSRVVDEIWNGLEQLEFVHRLVEMDIREIIAKLAAIRDTLARKGGVVANLTGSAGALEASLGFLRQGFRAFGPPQPRHPRSVEAESFFNLQGRPADSSGGRGSAEVYLSPSLQVGFAALSFSAAPYGSPEHAAELVLAHGLSTGALWEDIRMKGGAYGAFAQTDSLEGVFALSTYRDPNPLRSLESFSSILKQRAGQAGSPGSLWEEESLVKGIIGCYARETRPRTSAEQGFLDFLRFLYGIDDEARYRKLKELIGLEAEQIAGVERRLGLEEGSCPVVLAGRGAAEKAAKALGAELRELPV
jgi:Zn-dependent M16 (insulinase) family peptidase